MGVPSAFNIPEYLSLIFFRLQLFILVFIVLPSKQRIHYTLSTFSLPAPESNNLQFFFERDSDARCRQVAGM